MKVTLFAYTILSTHAYGLLSRLKYDVNSTSEADLLHEFMGRECYKSHHKPNAATATNASYLAHIQQQNHTSIFEHSSATFYVQDGSRSMLLELERHGFHSFSVESQRYVDTALHHPSPVHHPTLTDEQIARLDAHYATSLNLYKDTYNTLRDMGLSIKQSREAAREFLPNATPVDFGITANTRAWRDFLLKRETVGADRMIFAFAKQVHEELRAIAPNTMADLEWLSNE